MKPFQALWVVGEVSESIPGKTDSASLGDLGQKCCWLKTFSGGGGFGLPEMGCPKAPQKSRRLKKELELEVHRSEGHAGVEGNGRERVVWSAVRAQKPVYVLENHSQFLHKKLKSKPKSKKMANHGGKKQH